MIHVIAPPDYPQPQLDAMQALAERAASFRAKHDEMQPDKLAAIKRDLARRMTHRTIAKRNRVRPDEVKVIATIFKIQREIAARRAPIPHSR